VRCTNVRGRTVITIVRGEHAYRFETEREAAPVLLTEVFRGAPLRMTTGKHRRATAHSDKMEIGLFCACFALVVLSMVWKMIPGLPSGMFWSLGWMAIPLIWMVYCLRRPGVEKGQTGFSLGVGAMSAIFSCVFLWLTPTGRPDNWMQLLVPVLAIVVLTVSVCVVAGRGFKLRAILAVALVSFAAFAPGAARCLNEMFPARQVNVSSVNVVELVDQYDRGDWVYFVVAEEDGVQSGYQVSREEYMAIKDGQGVQIIRTTGALGIDYTDVRLIPSES